MTLQAQSLAFVTLLLLLVIKIEGNSIPKVVYKNGTYVSLSSPKLNEDVNQIRPLECRNRPWICSRGEFPPRSLCCRDRCVDVTSDIDNCGLCGIRCIFNWQCCNRLCINININPLNCGRCGRACPIGSLCLFGLCSFDQPLPPPSSPVPPFSPVPPEQKAPQSLPHQPQSPKMAPGPAME